MDFTQKKLTRAEWESIEIPIAPNEKEIVQMICRGYHSLTIRENAHTSLFSLIKIPPTKEMEYALYQKYFQPWIALLFTHFPTAPCPCDSQHDLNKLLEIGKSTQSVPLKSADKIRMQHLDETIQQNRANIFEYTLLELCHALVAPSLPPYSFSSTTLASNSASNSVQTNNKNPEKKSKNPEKVKSKSSEKPRAALHPPIFYVYTLNQLKKTSIQHKNIYVLRFVEQVLKRYQTEHASTDVLFHAYECIEKNPYLIRYEDRTLFPHQKRLFQICKTTPENPKLILYIAPTGTGKTLSPIALAEGFRVIFVCVARHVGFALAQTAISVGRKIATAFGCDTADGIRLHNHSAKEFIRNKRSGGIGKIDHTIGDNVELMICDVQSYIPAMYYMMSFHDPSTLVTFWDEPTITLDKELPADVLLVDSVANTGAQEEEKTAAVIGATEAAKGAVEIIPQPLDAPPPETGKSIAQMIHRNWTENRIPRMILSCATLPREEEILPVLSDFRSRFEDAEIHTISSVDCRKSIGLLNSTGFPVLPHCLFQHYDDLMDCVRFCEEDLTTLRYFDLREMIRFLRLLRDSPDATAEISDALKFHLPLDKITLQEVKQQYLHVLKIIPEEDWPTWFALSQQSHPPRWIRPTTTTTASNSLRKINSSSSAMLSDAAAGKPLSKIHSVDGSLFAYSAAAAMQATGVEKGLQNIPITPPADPYAGILLTTADAYTLTDGPTIYLAENVEKIGQFYIQQSHISPAVFQNIQTKIQHNDRLAKEITRLETELELEYAKKNASLGAAEEKSGGGGGKAPAAGGGGGGKTLAESKITEHLTDQISLLRSQICNVSLEPVYIPNHPTHLNLWCPPDHSSSKLSTATSAPNSTPYYVPLDEQIVRQIMTLDIEAYMKLLLLMGIGVFPKVSAEHAMPEAQFQYLELMKGLAKEQRLYLIIANSDYIYGTNYQFCHGIIGKDLTNMTQQKQKQAMGRIGRHNVQQEYTVRFRNDDLIRQLWTRPSRNVEAENMCLLFSS
jgi:hypothetical protein